MNILRFIHIKLARHYNRKRMLHKAVKHFSKVGLNALPVTDQVNYAMAYYETDRTDTALELLNQIIEKHESAFAHERRGHILRELSREEEAIHDLNKAIDLNPDNYLYWYTRGLIYQDWARYDEAIRDFEECIQRESKDSVASTYYELGMCYMHNEDYSNAVRVFQMIFTMPEKEIPVFYYRLAKAYEGQGLLDEALDAMKKGIELLGVFQMLPDHGERLAYDRVGYGPGAFRTFQREVQTTCSYREDLADLLYKNGEYEAAIQAVNDGLRIYTDRVDLYIKRAAMYRQLENWDQAEQDLNTALQADEELAKAVDMERVKLYRAQQREEEVLNIFKRLADGQPEVPAFLYWTADSYYMLQQYEQALVYNSKLVDLEQDDPVNFTQRGEILEELGHETEAIDAYSASIGLQDHRYLRMKRSYLYYAQGDYDEALLDLQSAAELDEEVVASSAYHNAMGHVLKSMGQLELSVDCYSKAIELNSENPIYYENRANSYMELRQLDLAEQDCETGMEKDRSYVDLINLRGYIAYLKEDYETSIHYAKQFIKRCPDVPWGYYNLGKAYYYQGNEDAALDAFNQSLNLDLREDKIYWYKAHIYYHRLEFGECIDNLVNWNLFYMNEEVALEQRIEMIHELNGFDEDVLQKAAQRIADMFGHKSQYLS